MTVCDFFQNLHNKAEFGTRIGSFAALASIFKHAKRQDVLPYGTKVLEAVMSSNFTEGDTLLRKYGIKLIQRIGMMFMKTVVCIPNRPELVLIGLIVIFNAYFPSLL